MSRVYFGNDTYQTWIKAPLTGMKAATQGWSSETQLLNGRTFIRRSDGSHRRFSMNWLGSMNDLDNSLHTIKDFADGIYGSGPFFWNDPYATTTNLFSPAWAAPAITIDSDWDAICPDGVGVTKTKVLTSSISSLVGNNTNEYPIYTAKYEAPGSPNIQGDKFTFYIPEGYTLWLGLHGHHGTTGGVFVKPYNNGVAGTAIQMTALPVSTGTRVNTSVSSTVANKAEVYLAKIASGTCTFHVVGLIAQLLKTGTTPEQGIFITGRGTTGLDFAALPEIEYYSANINQGQIGLSATMVEI